VSVFHGGSGAERPPRESRPQISQLLLFFIDHSRNADLHHSACRVL